MSITDELRAVAAKTECANGRCEKLYRGDLDHIADRIDAVHERGMADAELSAAPTEAQLSELGYVELPKDADGEYIHVGDVMEWPTTGETFEVVGIGDGTLFYVEGEDDVLADWTGASTKRHYRAATVEDVLREFALAVCKDEALTIRKGVVEEFAARLRLAGEDE